MSITPVKAYNLQKHAARDRGIPWRFTFETWVTWWEDNLGYNWMKKRGRYRGNYVMARLKDLGPYSPENVKCVLVEENCSERKINGSNGRPPTGERNGMVKLTEKQVIEIFYAKGTQKQIAAKYGITDANVRCIRNRKSWPSVIGKLPDRNFESDHRKKLTDEQVRKIYLAKDDWHLLAKKYKVSHITVWEIKHKKKRKKVTTNL